MKTLLILSVAVFCLCPQLTAQDTPPSEKSNPRQQEPEARVQLGIHTEQVTATLSSQLTLPQGIGLVVVAKRKGVDTPLQMHDVLLKIDDQWIVNQEQLRGLLGMYSVGETVKLTIVRAGKQRIEEVHLPAATNDQIWLESVFDDVTVQFNHATSIKNHKCSDCHVPTKESASLFSSPINLMLSPEGSSKPKEIEKEAGAADQGDPPLHSDEVIKSRLNYDPTKWKGADILDYPVLEVVPPGQVKSRSDVFQQLDLDLSKTTSFESVQRNSVVFLAWKVSPSYSLTCMSALNATENQGLSLADPKRLVYGVRLAPAQ